MDLLHFYFQTRALPVVRMNELLQLLLVFLIFIELSHTKSSHHSGRSTYKTTQSIQNPEDHPWERKFLQELDRKILRKIAKKKKLLDAFLGGFLGILEIKKKLLFKLWKKKNSKKKKNTSKQLNDEHFYIPYYQPDHATVAYHQQGE